MHGLAIVKAPAKAPGGMLDESTFLARGGHLAAGASETVSADLEAGSYELVALAGHSAESSRSRSSSRGGQARQVGGGVRRDAALVVFRHVDQAAGGVRVLGDEADEARPGSMRSSRPAVIPRCSVQTAGWFSRDRVAVRAVAQDVAEPGRRRTARGAARSPARSARPASRPRSAVRRLGASSRPISRPTALDRRLGPAAARGRGRATRARRPWACGRLAGRSRLGRDRPLVARTAARLARRCGARAARRRRAAGAAAHRVGVPADALGELLGRAPGGAAR